MEFEYLTLLSWFTFGWFAHSAYLAWKMNRLLKKIADEHNVSTSELLKSINLNQAEIKVVKVPNLFTEQVGNSIMLYNKDTGNFVSQASTVEELAEKIYKFDNIKYAVVNHENKDFVFVEGKVKLNQITNES